MVLNGDEQKPFAPNNEDGNLILNILYENANTRCICYGNLSDRFIINGIDTLIDSVEYMVNSCWVDEAIEFGNYILVRMDNGIVWEMCIKDSEETIVFYRFLLEKFYNDN